MSKIEQVKIPMDIVTPRMIKLTKHRELEDARHPNNIEEGFEIIGQYSRNPIVGEPFWLSMPQQLKDGEITHYHFRTSLVTEVIGPKMFKTMNSVYIWEDVEE